MRDSEESLLTFVNFIPQGLIFHMNHLLTDKSHEVSILIFPKSEGSCLKICCVLKICLTL